MNKDQPDSRYTTVKEGNTEYDAQEVPDDRRAPPLSRFRQRADGGIDRTHRINFFGQLTPNEMYLIISELIAAGLDETTVGHIALTKVEFIEPDTCEYRFWCEPYTGAQTESALSIWTRLNQIHRIRNVDGVWPFGESHSTDARSEQ